MRRPLMRTLAVGSILALAVVSQVGAQGAGLRPAADAAGLNFGAAVTVASLDADAAYRRLLIDNVNMVSTVSEIDFGVVQPEPGVYDFAAADALVDFAAGNELTVRGHGLISPDGLPDWIVGGSWTAETLATVLADHVTEVVGRYAERNPGVVTQWDVVDEAFLPDGTLRDSLWRQVIGDDYIRIAFEAARAADPDALLFYDDFYDDLSVTQDAVDSGLTIVPGATADRSDCAQVAKCAGVQSTIASLTSAGVPIDGIGFQAHLLSPDPVDFATFPGWVTDLGLEWAITEFDVPVPVTEIASPDTLAFQADAYATSMSACLDADSCDTFVVWGITDRLPPTPDTTGGAFGGALWFDAADTPKPAAEAMADVLGVTEPEPTTTDVVPTEPATAPTVTSPPAEQAGDDSSTIVALVVAAGALAVVGAVIVLARRRAPDAKNP
ncbi:MAG: endo-1,4-beta-xylanase [Ilumatobacteraceae bacterium]